MRLLLLLPLLFFVACSSEVPSPLPHQFPALNSTYRGQGIITIPNSNSSFITLNQHVIPGLMSAMIMTYRVTPASLADGFNEGDNVTFTLKTDPELRSINITALEKK